MPENVRSNEIKVYNTIELNKVKMGLVKPKLSLGLIFLILLLGKIKAD